MEVEHALDPPLASLHAAVEALSAALAGGANAETCAAAARQVECRARQIAELYEPSSLLDRSITPPFDAQPALRFRVLVVDDEPDEISLLVRVLEPWFDVVVARGGREAAEILRAQPPDVVLTALYMPDENGLAPLDLARTSDETLRVPLIVLSGRADTDAKVLAFESGAFDTPGATGRATTRCGRWRTHCPRARAAPTAPRGWAATNSPW